MTAVTRRERRVGESCRRERWVNSSQAFLPPLFMSADNTSTATGCWALLHPLRAQLKEHMCRLCHPCHLNLARQLACWDFMFEFRRIHLEKFKSKFSWSEHDRTDQRWGIQPGFSLCERWRLIRACKQCWLQRLMLQPGQFFIRTGQHFLKEKKTALKAFVYSWMALDTV